MNGSIRLFAGTGKAIPPHDATLPVTMGGRGPGLHPDVNLARTSRANALVVGAEQAVSNALALMIVDLEHAVVIDRAAGSFPLPSPLRSVPTLVIRNVDALTEEQQDELLDWLQLNKGLTRVITTTSRPLFAMLETHEFSTPLYYRLNAVYVDLTSAV